MKGLDFPNIIQELLRRSLLTLHVNQLHELRQKARHDDLSEADKIYLVDLWAKFSSLPATSSVSDLEQKNDHNNKQDDDILAQEMKRLNVTIEKLRAAL